MKPLSGRSRTILITLGAFWLLIAIWQVDEHRRVRESSRSMLLNHARDIATSLEVILQSQTRFAAVSRDRLEAALEALSRSSELLSLALVNPAGEVVTAAGVPFPAGAGTLVPGTQRWDQQTLTVVELVQLPVTSSAAADDVPQADGGSGGGILLIERYPLRRSPYGSTRRRDERENEQNDPNETDTPADPPAPTAQQQPRDGQETDALSPDSGEPRRPDRFRRRTPADMSPEERADYDAQQRFRQWMRDHGRRGESPRYPPWLSEEQFQDFYEKYGLQKFLLVLSAREVHAQITRDLWERLGLVAAALLAVSALWFGWRSLQRAARLSLKLVRAQEMNTHLREMNTAAAGLAHETRNPLNAVRGLAQLIANDADSSSDSRQRARTVMAEVDRINSRLGEFLAYSRPKPPKPESLDLGVLIHDVVRTLDTDREEKGLTLNVEVPALRIIADEGQFRQVLFNLVLNACQASPRGGTVQIRGQVQQGSLVLSVVDQGPGVPEELREDIFRPYFTLSEQGTGLGLAVTRQIVLAHHWEIACLAPAEGGAEFQISGIHCAGRT